MGYVAQKPVQFDKPYAAGDSVPTDVVDKAMAKKLIRWGKLALVPNGDDDHDPEALQQALSSACEEAEATKAELDAAKEEVEALKIKIDKAKAKADKQKSELDKMKVEQEELKAENEKVSAELEALKAAGAEADQDPEETKEPKESEAAKEPAEE